MQHINGSKELVVLGLLLANGQYIFLLFTVLNCIILSIHANETASGDRGQPNNIFCNQGVSKSIKSHLNRQPL